MVQIFLTGASGYIGGDVLHVVAKTHPEYRIKALVRDTVKGQQISKAFSNVQLVEGDLDATELLRKEASDADVVLHLAATGHLRSVEAIHSAFQNSGLQKPAHWIQISGASALAAAELADKSRAFGSPSDLVFDDLDGIADITSMIRGHPSRAVDNYVLDVAASTPSVNTALVFPPIIYGQGRGPVNQRSIQIPQLARATLERGRGVRVGAGLSRWGDVHVHDVSALILRLLEKAVEEGSADKSLWNENGIYLTGVGELPFGKISEKVATAAVKQGLISDPTVEQLDASAFDALIPHGTVLYGTNARSHARRAKELLGWQPQGHSLEHEVPQAVEAEGRRMKA